ncbi:MAG: hypothetical protein WC934_12505 [Acidithiobacillus sp.]|jgi:hypothetical protein
MMRFAAFALAEIYDKYYKTWCCIVFARKYGVQVVGGSNPLAPTNNTNPLFKFFLRLLLTLQT